jgi:chloramphenicol 3-O phosphotransferase
MTSAGQIIILNGAPRSGKSSIAFAIQDTFEGPWMNLGVDVHARHITPPRYQPGIGLRPGGDRPEVAALVPKLYAALYESIAAHSRQGLNVVVDIGHHGDDLASRDILRDCAQRLRGLPVMMVGVQCPLGVIMQRRNQSQDGRDGHYLTGSPDDPIPAPVRDWQHAVHQPGIYDIEVDTSVLTPTQCADVIRRRLETPGVGLSANERLAASGS